MTLEKQFQTLFNNNIVNKNRVDASVRLAEDFAVEFAEWLSNRGVTKLQCKSYCKKNVMWFTDKKGIGATTKELLEIFKTEYYGNDPRTKESQRVG